MLLYTYVCECGGYIVVGGWALSFPFLNFCRVANLWLMDGVGNKAREERNVKHFQHCSLQNKNIFEMLVRILKFTWVVLILCSTLNIIIFILKAKFYLICLTFLYFRVRTIQNYITTQNTVPYSTYSTIALRYSSIFLFHSTSSIYNPEREEGRKEGGPARFRG